MTHSICLNFFHLLARKPNFVIQANSFIIFTCLNLVLLVQWLQANGLARKLHDICAKCLHYLYCKFIVKVYLSNLS